VDYSAVTKIIQAFIPAFENGILKADGMRYLHGVFNIGGTVSGRLSSSDPNMQNLPAGSAYGKLIKEMFMGPLGWLFAGADINSLEDYISALTTKDPMKLKVYIDGFDGHALRAASYFPEQLKAKGYDIDMSDPKSVNRIKKDDLPERQDSKAPTFALTYQGTWMTLVKNLGWSAEKAKKIEANFHELYKVSTQYIKDRLRQAVKDGFVTVAFGLRLRTPLLGAVVDLDLDSTPKEAAAEGRTAGNAMGQSYGLLNNRAAAAFMKRVHASEFRYDIKPVALIHDAIYLLIRNDPRVVEFANRVLIEEMSWQELPEIQHDTVKIGAALDLFYPNWATPVTLPVNADIPTIKRVCKEHIEAIKAKEAA
ncbi:MAG: DNA polymerase I, partial [Pseudomonas sp.]|nr:DNA polymerase I [Pseudomonas sp.]